MSGTMNKEVECWGRFELTVDGPALGNPFTDVKLRANFSFENRIISVDGFYNGDGQYMIRFMPDRLGKWTFKTNSNVTPLDDLSGEFICTEPSMGNHGLVRVTSTTHFEFADGTPYYPFGTTAYRLEPSRRRTRERNVELLKGCTV